MGLDYGVKRIGVAVSDERGALAFPKKTILNDSNAWKRLEEIFKSHDVEEIVVGESTNSLGNPNPLSPRIEIFIKELEKRLKAPVRKQKEFFTTVEARRISLEAKNKKAPKVPADASAAALILQRYLDKINQADKVLKK